ncbi:RHS repeat-associated core domain-containing protein [Pseudomonas shirazensis]|uniref:RHS repeat-associated core domain-containing protein n=3 Tax=Pseudomonas shirazensis TaxID=2745494 RepID=UPI00398888FA
MSLHFSAPVELARQAFDGLGRQLTVTVGGRTTGFDYKPGQLPPEANVLADGKRVAFTYEPALDNQLLSIAPAGEPANAFTFHPDLALPASSSGPLGTLAMAYSPAGKALEDTWSVDGKAHTTTWRHTLNGLRQGLVDSHGSDHRYEYDRFGRLEKHVQDDVSTAFTFDTFSRVETVTTTDASNTLVQTLTYDSLGREHTRTFTVTTAGSTRTCKQTLLYSELDQVVNRVWEDGSSKGQETFDYDNRGRLILYTADPAIAAEDPFGNRVTKQVFCFNGLDGYKQVDSTFAGGGTDTAVFSYAAEDLTQVKTITHSHSSWPASITLDYDACGRVIADSLGRQLTWDAQDRLTRVQYNGQTCDYRYDPSGNLTDRILGTTLTRSFYSGGLLTHEQTGSDVLQRIGDASTLFALNRITADVRTVTLLGCDAQGSVRLEADNSVRSRHYTAHGAEPEDPANGPYGYAGERREPLTGWYIPGGYRPYDPIVMGFLSPDSESPFGRGGLNPYAYCGGDPVNRIDPDGHAWWKWLVAGVGLVLGAVAVVASFGTAAPAVAAIAAGGIGALTASGAAAIGAATLGAISLGTGLASTVLEATGYDQKAASILGWVSLGTGLVGSALEITPKAATFLGRLPGRGSAKLQTKMMRSSKANNMKQPVRTVGNSDVILSLPGDDTSVAFHRNLYDSNLAAFETHGTEQGRLMTGTGTFDSAKNVALDEIAPRLNTLPAYANRPNKPVVLLACKAGKTGAAQEVANTLKRPVIAYDELVSLREIKFQNHPQFTGHTFAGSNGVFERLPIPRIGPFPDNVSLRPGVPRKFTPG